MYSLLHYSLHYDSFTPLHACRSCAKDAIGYETTIHIELGGEHFSASGLMVTERNWLEVYPYTNWGGGATLPALRGGESFAPAAVDFKEGRTQPPPRLTERDLLSKMDEFGIGTDATVAEHIQKQLERGYATKDQSGASQVFAPTALGLALISAYRKMGLRSLWQPALRGLIERNIAAVASGQRTKEEVLVEAVEHFRGDFAAAQSQAGILVEEVAAIVFPQAIAGGSIAHGGPHVFGQGGPRGVGSGGNGNGGGGYPFGPCPCGGQLLLLPTPAPSVSCSSAPLCRFRVDFPRATQSVQVSEELCEACAGVSKLQLVFNRMLVPPGSAPSLTSCVLCDAELKALLQTLGPPVRRAEPGGGRGAVGRGRLAARGGRGGGAARGGGAGRAAARGTGGRSGRGRSVVASGQPYQPYQAGRGSGRGQQAW
jgi:DNA topoisomerase III